MYAYVRMCRSWRLSCTRILFFWHGCTGSKGQNFVLCGGYTFDYVEWYTAIHIRKFRVVFFYHSFYFCSHHPQHQFLGATFPELNTYLPLLVTHAPRQIPKHHANGHPVWTRRFFMRRVMRQPPSRERCSNSVLFLDLPQVTACVFFLDVPQCTMILCPTANQTAAIRPPPPAASADRTATDWTTAPPTGPPRRGNVN